MIAAIRHRGPDAEGTWSRGEVLLGHCRLAVVDLQDGAQPMATPEGDLVVSYNGEIYNAPELRRELENLGHRFRTRNADTEILLHAYRQWGTSLVDHLNGMWAFALYDEREGRLFLSRDRFGEKPLYYAVLGRTLLFGSELSALRQHPLCPGLLDERALRKYFAYGFIPAPYSMIVGVRKLPGGHSLTFDITTGTLKVWRYWQFVLEPMDEPRRAEAIWTEQLRCLLAASVKRRMQADVPVGVLLSGGIDSSGVAALAAHSGMSQNVPTFTLGFRERSFDESAFATEMARAAKSPHFLEYMEVDDAEGTLRDVCERIDEPLADPSLVPSHALCRLARQQVKVVQGGDGGDELFAGYDPFRALRAAKLYHAACPKPVHEALLHLGRWLPRSDSNLSFDFKVNRFLGGVGAGPSLWLPTWMAPVAPGELTELLRKPASSEEVYSEAIEAWERAGAQGPVDRALHYFTSVYLEGSILPKIDRASMLNGLEVRSPFLDRDVVEFSRRLPSRWKFRGGTGKYLLKRALDTLVPPSLLARRKKGFGLPIAAWMRQGRFPLDFEGLPEQVDRKFVEHAWRQHLSGVGDRRGLLWGAQVLSRWCRQRHQRHLSASAAGLVSL